MTSRLLTPFSLLPEPAVIVSSNLAGEKWQPCPPQAAGICGPALPGPLRLPARQPTALDGAPPPGPGPRSPAEPASSVHVRCPHLCCCTGLHHLHCSPLLPAGLLEARCGLCHPPEHSGAPGPCQRWAQSPHFCQRGPCTVPTPVCHPVLHWVFPRLGHLHWIPTESYQDQPVFLLVVGEHKGGEGPEFSVGCHEPLPYPLLKSLASNLLHRGPLKQKAFLWGTCLSIDCIVVVSQSLPCFLILYFCDSIFGIWKEFRCPLSAVTKEERSFWSYVWKIFSLSDLISINAFKNKWSISLFNFILL